MDQLRVYIRNARAHGKSDDQIKQALLRAGWPQQTINSALHANPAKHKEEETPSHHPTQKAKSKDETTKTKAKRKKLKFTKKTAAILVVVIILAVGAYIVLNQKTSYQVVAQNFVTAMENKDQAKADSLETPYFKEYVNKVFGTTSYYSYCNKYGQVCTKFFESSFTANATKVYGGYTAVSGIVGKSVEYTTSVNSGTTCTRQSLVLDLIPSGNSWLIDSISPSVSSNGASCT